MKNLIEKLFKREPALNYIITEYQPTQVDGLRTGVKVTEYEDSLALAHDEMEIDNLYQRS